MKNLIILSIIILFFSACASKADKNFTDLKKNRKGMSNTQVDLIMTNSPKLIKEAFWDKNLYVNYYDSGFGTSDDFKIIFSKKDSLVVSIEYGD
ncbi:hypothetical protein [Sinomicrobium weinanense]|uniref:Lipoprotein SmpA/OmlA domain-containing protein n=1 Tax=Sinomicrobium weinanense TaxID=2842200 RepID=A0A926JT85_9FLAO|nr:hypothetical protein [Sinomicrobium weinanense]MBC9796889.1 hypothetical protein [Sinomicrobium weinanense]MBU3124197.1 hypothetical protein [Sinomicrobium weinanense]